MQKPVRNDLAKLEFEFAKNPQSKAFIPLAAAYLDSGRTVEAMVVCKIGIDAHPQLAIGRWIMARVFCAQAKYPKALEELHQIGKLYPQRKEVVQLLTKIRIVGSSDKKKQVLLRKALVAIQKSILGQPRLSPAGVRGTHDQNMNEAITVVQPNPLTSIHRSSSQVVLKPKKQPSTAKSKKTKSEIRTGQAKAPLEVVKKESNTQVPKPVPREKSCASAHSQNPTESPKQEKASTLSLIRERIFCRIRTIDSPARNQMQNLKKLNWLKILNTLELLGFVIKLKTFEKSKILSKRTLVQKLKNIPLVSSKTKNKQLVFTLCLAGILSFCLTIYTMYLWQAGLRQQDINKHITLGRASFGQDTYAGYQRALRSYHRILALKKNHPQALSRLLFINAVLVGEYGESKTTNNSAQNLLNLADQEGHSSIMLTAASALQIAYGGGDWARAADLVEQDLKRIPNVPLLNTTLGLILLKQGKWVRAKEYLLKSARYSDVRALVGLGECALQQSMYQSALQYFNRGLKINRLHVRSLLGAALVSVLRSNKQSDSEYAARLVERFFKGLKDEASSQEIAQAHFLNLILLIRKPDQHEQAMQNMEAFLRKHHSNALFHFVAARELRRHNHLGVAKYLIQRALLLDPVRADYVLEEAAILLARREFELARMKALLSQKVITRSGRSWLIIGDAYQGERRWDQALDYYEKCLKFEDVKSICHLRLGDLLNNQPERERDQAQFEYEFALSKLWAEGKNRLASQAAISLAKIYLEKRKFERFFESVQKATTIDPRYAPPYAIIATNLDLANADGRKEAKELCSKYLKMSSHGEYRTRCRQIIRR